MNLSPPVVFVFVFVFVLLSFSLVGAQNLPLPLANGVPEEFLSLAANQFQRFAFTPGPGITFVTVGLNAYSGDPDLYLSSSPTVSNTDYEWADTRPGGGVLVQSARAAEPFFLAVFAGGNFSARGSVVCHSFTDSASLQSAPLVLRPGMPLVDYIEDNHVHYYTFEVTDERTFINFILSQRSGDPDLYINGPNKEEWPSTTNYEWSATVDRGEDVVRLPTPLKGQYRIMVHAWSFQISGRDDSATFFIAVNRGPEVGDRLLQSADHLRLSDGISYPLANVYQEWQWAVFIVPSRAQNLPLNEYTLTISVDPLGFTDSGAISDVDIFCSDADRYPTDQSNPLTLFSSTGYGYDYVPIPLGEVNSGSIYCGFQPYNDALYLVTASMRQSVLLQANRFHVEVLETRQSGLFVIEIPDTLSTGMIFYTRPLPPVSAQPTTRSTVDIYFGVVNGDAIDIDKTSTYEYSDKGGSDEESHSIAASTSDCATALKPCRYNVLLVPITTIAKNHVFSVSLVFPSDTLRRLVPSSRLAGQLYSVTPWSFYEFSAQANEQITLVVEGKDGSLAPNVFVRRNDRFPATHAQNDFHNVEVQSSHTLTWDTRTTASTWQVSVFNPNVSHPLLEYFITASGFTSVEDSSSSTGIAHISSSVLPSFSSSSSTAVPQSSSSSSILLTSSTIQPISRSSSSSSSSILLTSSIIQPISRSSSSSSSTGGSMSFSSSLTRIPSDGTFFYLDNGEPQLIDQYKQTYRYFRFTFNTWPTTVIFTVLSYAGDPDIYVSKSPLPLPSETSYTWKSENDYSLPDEIRIAPDDADACNPQLNGGSCTYYIAILAWEYNIDYNRYVITAHTGDANVILLPRRPYESLLRPGEVNYFTLVNEHGTSATVIFGVTALSGNPDMWVSGASNCVKPGPTCFQYASTAGGGDLIAIRGAIYGRYFLAVQNTGRTIARYTLIAYSYVPNDPNAVGLQLINGVSFSGFLGSTEIQRYFYNVTLAVTKIVFFVARRYGDPDIYVNSPSHEYYPSLLVNDFYSGSEGDDILTIRNPVEGVYRVSVGAFGSSQYSISVVQSGTPLVLADGQVYGGDVLENEYDYVTFNVPDIISDPSVLIFSTHVLFSAASVVTDVDLFCSDTNPRPTSDPSTYRWSSVSSGVIDNVIISSRQDELHPGVYTCAVAGWTDSRYTVVAYMNAALSLQAGIALELTTTAHTSSYFTFSLAASNTASNFTITTLHDSGIGFLYVSTTGEPDPDNPQTYQYSSTETYYAAQSVLVPGSTCRTGGGVASCTYYILVQAGNDDTTYTILAETTDSSTAMTAGRIYTGTVALASYRYYSLNVPARDTLTIQLTVVTGDPDLFVSQTIPHPSVRINTWSSTSQSNDIVRINNAATGMYYVSVFGARASEYRINYVLGTGTSSNSTPIALVTGVPQSGYFPTTGEWSFYTWSPPSIGWPYYVKISVQRSSGDPDLFVNSDGSRPTIDAYQFRSAETTEFDEVYIFSNSTYACNPLTQPSCMYTIGVYAYSAMTSYSILVTTSNAAGAITTIQLNNLQSLERTLARNQVDYFSFTNPIAGWTVNVVVLPLYGNPDIYVSLTTEHPSAAVYDYKGEMSGGDIVSIDRAAAIRYYIAVQASGFTDCKFTILVNAYDPARTIDSPLALANAVPSYDVISATTNRYYTFIVTVPNESLVFGVIPGQGYPRLLVNAPSRSYFATGTNNADYVVATSNNNDVVGIPRAAAGTWRITVTPQRNMSSYYSLIGIRGNASLSMVERVVYPASLQRYGYAYFNFYVSPSFGPFTEKSLTFVVTPLDNSPAVDMYCSTANPSPSNTSYVWWSNSNSVNSIQLSGRDGGLRASQYYCSAHASRGVSIFHYQVTFVERVNITAGIPIVRGSNRGEIIYFTFNALTPASAQAFTITTTAVYGEAYIYVTRSPAFDPDPDATNNLAKSEYPFYPIQQVQIPASDCATSGQLRCVYSIAVYTPSEASYSILLSTATSMNLLVPGQVQSGYLQTGQEAYFQFTVPSNRMNVTLALTSSDDTDIFISRTQQRPNIQNADWVVAQFGPNEYWYIDWTDSHFLGISMMGTYYVTVLGFAATDFRILLTLHDADNPLVNTSITLTDGQPLYNRIEANVPQFLTFRPSPDGWPYSVSFSFHNLNVFSSFMFSMRNDRFPVSGADGTWGFGFPLAPGNQVIVTAYHPNACNPIRTPNCQYYIGIFDSRSEEYYLTVSTSKAHEQLLNRVATSTRRLEAREWDYFIFRNTGAPNNTVIFSINAVYGDPNIYVSNGTTFPTVANSQYRGEQDMHDVIIIPRAPSMLYSIGVLANYYSAEYVLSAFSYDPSHPERYSIPLVQGQPHQDALPGNEYRYYTFPFTGLSAEKLVISLVHQLGDPDIYVNYWNAATGVWPTNVNYDYAANNVGSDNLVINSALPGMYAIAIHASDGFNAVYQVVAARAGFSQVAQVGQLYRGTLVAGDYNFYSVSINTVLPGADLSFILTIDYGDGDLFVSDTIEKPTQNNFTWYAESIGSDVVTLSNRTHPGSIHIGKYYIGVLAFEDISYSFVVVYNSRLSLIDGRAQNMIVLAGRQQLFDISVPNESNSNEILVNIQTSILYGVVSIFVGVQTLPVATDPGSYQYSSQEGPAFIDVHRSLCANANPCLVIVLAVARLPTTFSLLASTSLRNIVLRDGQSVQGEVSIDRPVYYRFDIQTPHSNVTVRLTSVLGDADIYCSYQYVRPNSTSTDWRSDNVVGEDVIYFDYTETRFVSMPMPLTYYCAVFAKVSANGNSAKYHVVYTAFDTDNGSTGNYVRLNVGQPQAGSMPGRSYLYFSYIPSSQSYPYDITFLVTSLEGNPDVYISNDGSTPSLSRSMWKSELDPSSADSILISSSDPLACSSADVVAVRCQYLIAVYAADFTSARFQILVSITSSSDRASLVTLSSTIPVAGSVRYGGIARYVVDVPSNNTRLSVILTALSGNPDIMWVSATNYSNVNRVSKEFGSDAINIVANRGLYYFVVFGESKQNGARVQAYYTIVTTVSNSIRLLIGQPQDDTLEVRSSRYYSVSFNNPSGANPFTVQLISVGELIGVNMYLTNNGREPTSVAWQWRSTSGSGTSGYIIVDPSDPEYVVQGEYQLLVATSTVRAVYTIVCSDGSTTTTLMDGRAFAQNDPVRTVDYRYFRGIADNTQRDLSVTVTVLTGSVTVYLSSSAPRPYSGNNEGVLTTTANSGGGILIVRQYNIVPGYYYLSVRTDSAVAARYSIVMTTSHITAALGMPQQGSCDTVPRYYRVNLGATTLDTLQDVVMSVSPASTSFYTGKIQVYIVPSRNDVNNNTYPSAVTRDAWSYTITLDANGGFFSVSKNDNSLRACISTGACALYVGLACTVPSQYVSYYFTVSLGKPAVSLRDGEGRVGQLRRGEVDYYVNYIDNARSLLLMVDSCIGNADLYVSSLTKNPGRGNAERQSIRIPPVVDYVFLTSPSYLNSVWYSAVVATTGTEYRFMALSTNATSYIQIQPQVNNPILDVQMNGATMTIVFQRIVMPLFYTRIQPVGIKYTLRYSLYATFMEEQYEMQSLCGLQRATLLASILDAEIDEQFPPHPEDRNDPMSPMVRSETAEFLLSADKLNLFKVCTVEGDASTCSTVPSQRYKMNVVVEVVRTKGMSVQNQLWATYQPITEFSLADYPFFTSSEGGGGGSDSGLSLSAGLAIVLPLIALVLCSAYCIYRRHTISSSRSSMITNWTSSGTSVNHHLDLDQSYSYTNGTYTQPSSFPQTSIPQGFGHLSHLSNDEYSQPAPVVAKSTNRFSGFGSDSATAAPAEPAPWYANDRYSTQAPSVEVSADYDHYSATPQQQSSFASYQPPSNGTYGF